MTDTHTHRERKRETDREREIERERHHQVIIIIIHRHRERERERHREVRQDFRGTAQLRDYDNGDNEAGSTPHSQRLTTANNAHPNVAQPRVLSSGARPQPGPLSTHSVINGLE
jgi:hypothetical protein